MGVEPESPLDSTVQKRSPTVRDLGFPIGTLWVQPSGPNVWMLLNTAKSIAEWVPLYPNNTQGTTDFPTDSGTAVEMNGVLNMFGDNVLTTSGAGNTVNIKLLNGMDGQVLIGGGTKPLWANITSTDRTVSITDGPNTINLEVMAAGVTTVSTNSGDATPLNGSINLVGANVVGTSASGNTVTVRVIDADDGQVPIAATSAATAYANITSMDASITVTDGANTIDLSYAGGGGGGSAVSFFYYQASDTVTLVPNPYFLGYSVALTKVSDVGNNVYAGSGSGSPAVFTAPLDGIYLIGGAFTSRTNINPEFYIVTTGGTFEVYPGTKDNRSGIQGAVLVKLSASDTVQWKSMRGLSGAINGGINPYYTWIYGYLVTKL